MKKILALTILLTTLSVFAQTKPAYMVSEITVKDMDGYKKDYTPKAVAWIEKAGGTFIVGGDTVDRELIKSSNFDKDTNRITIVKFENLEKAKAFFNAPERKEMTKLRDKYASSKSFIVEGK